VRDIPRPLLFAELWEQSQEQSVLVYGSPGAGKTWLLTQFIKQCESNSRNVIPLVAEDYQVTSLSELYRALGFSQPIPVLMAGSGPGSVLVIDGLDALRAESSQKAFRELISEVLLNAPGMSVIASIRTYDLQESREFRTLLSPSFAAGIKGLGKLAVDDLSAEELSVAGENTPALKQLIVEAPLQFRELLRNPFNLNLALGLQKEGVSMGELSALTSQVQLLSRYWYYRVESGPGNGLRQRVLRDAVERMVETKVLSLPALDFVDHDREDALQILQSREIFRRGVTNRLAFSHNIFFDYAVARLLLDEVALFSFIKADPSRTLFFRPSLTMFFHHLWANDRALFWRVSKECDVAQDLPERARVISCSVVCEAARSLDELNVLVPILKGQSDLMFLARVLRAAQAVGVLQSRRRQLWIEFIGLLTTDMHVEIVNEILALLAIVKVNAFAADRRFLNCASRNVVEWAISPANGIPDERAAELSNVVVGRLLDLITDTYETAPLETSAIVRSILNRLGSKRAGPNEAFRISHSMPSIIEHDAQLAKEIYVNMYSYVEDSVEQTTMGGGPATTFFLSNRKQDYNSALYALMTRFRTFAEKAPIVALEAALIAVEREVEREHLKKDRVAHTVVQMRIGQHRTIRYRSDHSEIWDGSLSNEHTSLNLLASSFEKLPQLEEKLRDRMLLVVLDTASVAIIWKRLVETASRHPETLYGAIKPLLFSSRFISAPEVTVSVGELLRQAYDLHLITRDDSALIERAILAIQKSRILKRYEKPSSIQKRLLSCIPLERMTNAQLMKKKTRWEAHGTRDNRPFHRHTFGAFTPGPDDLLREEGIDPHSEANAPILDLTKRLATFESSFLNSPANPDDCEDTHEDLTNLHALVKRGTADAQVLENARGTLIAAAKVIGKTVALDVHPALLREARIIAIEGSTDPSPEFDPKYHSSFDSPGWGAPVSRIEAGQALGYLIWNYFSDKEIVDAFIQLATDEVPAVRFQVAHFLPSLYKQGQKDVFWFTLNEMLRREKTHGVMLGLLQSLGRVCGEEPEKALDAVELVLDHGLPSTDRSEASRALIEIPLVLYVVRDIERARMVLRRFESDFVRFSRELLDGVFLASHYLAPRKEFSDSVRDRARAFLSSLIDVTRSRIAGLYQGTSKDEGREALKVLDAIATRLVFSFGLEQHGVTGTDVLDTKERRMLFAELKPLLYQLVDTESAELQSPMLPRTAYYLLQLMNGVLSFDPVGVLRMAAAICRAGSIFRFEIDMSARDEAIKLVEAALADHRDSLKESAQSVGSLLDVFAKAGWSEAIALTFRLDEAFR
jgi:hypothetical protein